MTTPEGPARKLAALALGSLVALLLAEGIARLAEMRSVTRVEPRRARIYPRPEAERGQFRILVVGDSFTAGAAVAVKEIYSRRLADLLANRFGADAFEVLTLAAPGWNTETEVRWARPYFTGLEPDLILVGVCLNDPEPSDRELVRRHFLEAGLREPGSYEEGWPYRASAAVRLAVDGYRAWRSGPAVIRYYRSFYDEELPSWRAFRKALERFRKLSRRNRARLVLVVFPIFDSPLDRDYPYRDLHQQIGSTAQGLRIRTLDLLATYEGMDFRSLRVARTDPHPSALAHRLAAERIFEYLEAEGLLAKRPQGKRSSAASRASGKSRGAT